MRGKGKFFYLLISLLLVLFLYPSIEGYAFASKALAFFFSLVLIVGVYSISGNSRLLLVISLILSFPTVVLVWVDQLNDSVIIDMFSYCLMSLFCFFTVFCIIKHIMSREKVTADILAGAACAYLLLGISWGVLFALYNFINSMAFSLPEAAQTGAMRDWSIFNYYSFTTLTTLGYGDIVPQTSRAQSLAILESVMGVLFTALLISRLVGMYLFQLKEGSD